MILSCWFIYFATFLPCLQVFYFCFFSKVCCLYCYHIIRQERGMKLERENEYPCLFMSVTSMHTLTQCVQSMCGRDPSGTLREGEGRGRLIENDNAFHLECCLTTCRNMYGSQSSVEPMLHSCWGQTKIQIF